MRLKRIRFQTRCLATLVETWEANVPEDLEGEALHDALMGALGPEGTADFIEESGEDEQDRDIDLTTIDEVTTT